MSHAPIMTPRRLRPLDPLAVRALHNEDLRDPRRDGRSRPGVRKRYQPPRAEPWRDRRRDYLREVERREKYPEAQQ